MGASAVSVFENNKALRVTIHIFTDGYSLENLEKTKQLAQQYKGRIIVYTLNMDVFADFHIKVVRFSRITYGRLVMPKVLENVVDRYVYIDADAICVQSLESLLDLNLEGTAMGAVSDAPDGDTYRADFLQLKSKKYFNDGIMVVDVNEWNRKSITEQAFSFQNEPKERFLGQSQDVLNLVFDGTNYPLSHVYNESDGGIHAGADAVIIHWTGRRKPWQMVLTDLDQQWRDYNALSPWDTITHMLPIKLPENYHDFQQWGHYQKVQGNFGGYVKGVFWYAWLRLRYKMNF